VNDAELLGRVIDLAAPDAVCTDRPGELRAEHAALDSRQPGPSVARALVA
jgi:hypothetical protein